MIDLKSAALIGGVGVIGTMWSQVKQVFTRISSLLVVSIELHGVADDALMAYAWNHMRCSKFGARRFTSMTQFLRPKDRQGLIGYEMLGNSVTFFSGWRPLFVSTNVDVKGNSVSGMKVSFIRGTFDLDKLIGNAVEEFDTHKHSSSTTQSRYYVKKCFGAKYMPSEGVNAGVGRSTQTEPKGIAKNDEAESVPPAQFRPLLWNKDDVGLPTSKVPFKNLSYNSHIEDFKTEIRRWKQSEKWYKSKGLNWRFGAGIFGPPGTGKTSFVRAVGQELDMPIHVYDLTTMDNEDLCSFWRTSLAIAPCIVLFEDIDRIFDKEKNIKNTGGKSVTLDCLLNCIAGVEPANGILVLVTANDLNKVDPALGIPNENGDSTRPGRLDRGVHFGILSPEARLDVANRILSDYPDAISATVNAGIGETGAQFESRCAKLALATYWGKPKIYVGEDIDLSKPRKLENSETQDEETENVDISQN